MKSEYTGKSWEATTDCLRARYAKGRCDSAWVPYHEIRYPVLVPGVSLEIEWSRIEKYLMVTEAREM